MSADDEIDPPCITCSGRKFSGCTCPRAELTEEEKELGRQARLTRAELLTERRAGR
jgi:hypothetical protein